MLLQLEWNLDHGVQSASTARGRTGAFSTVGVFRVKIVRTKRSKVLLRFIWRSAGSKPRHWLPDDNALYWLRTSSDRFRKAVRRPSQPWRYCFYGLQRRSRGSYPRRLSRSCGVDPRTLRVGSTGEPAGGLDCLNRASVCDGNARSPQHNAPVDLFEDWIPIPFPGTVTHVGAWKHGYGSLWFKDGRIKVLPAECGLLFEVKEPDGSRVPYSNNQPGKPMHVGKRWFRTGLCVEQLPEDGHHEVLRPTDCFVEMRQLHDGVELRSSAGATASLRCEFDRPYCRPPVQLAVLRGNPADNRCGTAGCTLTAPKRCIHKRCRAHCRGDSTCPFHSRHMPAPRKRQHNFRKR
jgi:hypothetical protein